MTRIDIGFKDFRDIAYLLENHSISDGELQRALKATFEKRGMPRPSSPSIETLRK